VTDTNTADITATIDNAFERLSRSLLDALAARDKPHRRTAKVPGGEMIITLTAEEATAWDADPDAAAAKRFGLNTAEFDAWVALDGGRRCGASTDAGPCSNLIGPLFMSAADWKACHHNARCPKHA